MSNGVKFVVEREITPFSLQMYRDFSKIWQILAFEENVWGFRDFKIFKNNSSFKFVFKKINLQNNFQTQI